MNTYSTQAYRFPVDAAPIQLKEKKLHHGLGDALQHLDELNPFEAHVIRDETNGVFFGVWTDVNHVVKAAEWGHPIPHEITA